MERYDCIVIGAGHAGIEAAHAAAKLGCRVLLTALSLDDIGKLSCNPAVGGVAKGNLVRETDSLGGLIAKITDQCALGYRILNRSKGKAVWATRAQVDMFLYPKVARSFLERMPQVRLLQAKVRKVLVKHGKVCGIETNFGEIFQAKTVIICAGTFLASTIHIGLNSFPGGRLSEESSDELFLNIKHLGLRTKHFKTGTCARLDKRSIDFSKMIEQFPDLDALPFASSTRCLRAEPLSCYITHTNIKTHRIIVKNLKRSPLYTGKIKAKGVRYCPSLEDKVVKFSDHPRHQIFIEPQGRESFEVYPNGLSTSLPFDVQLAFIHTVAGLERAVIVRPGYGIEHGLIDTLQLHPTLETKKISGLYFAGQVNGTTGYEEAAAQGIIAGINAALTVQKRKPFIVRREEAFIGVLIDDLTTKGTDEPYRMFTSRSEFRLSLRESNADIRLAPAAYALGLLHKDEYARVLEKKATIDRFLATLKNKKIIFGKESISLYHMLKRPAISYRDIQVHLKEPACDGLVQYEIEIQAKYEGFLRRELIWLTELKDLDKIKLPQLNFKNIPSLSKEVVEKLTFFRPATLGEALRISGITPAAIVTIYNFMRARKAVKNFPKSRRNK